MIKLEKIFKSDFYPLILSLVAAVAWMFIEILQELIKHLLLFIYF